MAKQLEGRAMANAGAATAKGPGGKAAGAPSAGGGPRVKFSIRIKIALAITALVVAVIITMAMYMRAGSSSLLRGEIISSAERETEHLAMVAEDAAKSNDDLSLLASVENMKKILKNIGREPYWGVFFIFIWYKNGFEVEGGHPMLHGFVRLKGRLERRSGFPVEKPWDG